MPVWTIEHGTLWALELEASLPPIYTPQAQVTFVDLAVPDAGELAVAMGLPSPEPILQRLHSGRRCFGLRAAGQIAAYGWVTRGAECVGELEREFRLNDGEAYIWDCGTIPAWRRQGCYSALLSHLIYQMHSEGILRAWIGASRQNQPSVRGFISAGFQPVVDITYCRCYRLTLLWIYQARSTQNSLVAAAYRILLADHERRIGRLAIGYKP